MPLAGIPSVRIVLPAGRLRWPDAKASSHIPQTALVQRHGTHLVVSLSHEAPLQPLPICPLQDEFCACTAHPISSIGRPVDQCVTRDQIIG